MAIIQELLLRTDTAVTCPKCEHEFSLEQGFARKALETLTDSSRTALTAVREQERAAADQRARALATEQNAAYERALAEMRRSTEQHFKPQMDALKTQLQDSQTRLAQMDQREQALSTREQQLEARVAIAAQQRADALIATERESHARQVTDMQTQLASLRDEQVQLRDERVKLQDEKAALELDVRRRVDEQIAQRETTVRAQEAERAKLREADLQKKLDDLTAQLADAQRRAEQGSQQMQGEVLELAIEEGLRHAFAIDTIEEVKKGQRGGDVIQRVLSRTGQATGVILWETKRAKDWSLQWPSKLKDDMRAAGAEVGVLVTMPGAIPKEWSAGQCFGLHEDIWVTTWSTALQLAEVLRSALLDVHKQRLVSLGKGEKMEAVYDYVTSPQFAQKLKAVFDTFKKMREELESEKNVTQRRWARREKQLQIGTNELLGIGGEVQGLAQQALPQLELESGNAVGDDT